MRNITQRSTTTNLCRRLAPACSVAAALFFTLFLSGCEYLDDFDDFGKDKDKNEQEMYEVKLTDLNNSGVTGTATVMYNEEGEFTVLVNAKNLVPSMVHPQHIHGFDMEDKDAVCPPSSAAGQDGLLTLADGLPFYGPVLLPLDDELVPLEVNNFPKASASGSLNYIGVVKTSSLVAAIDAKYEEEQTMEDFKAEERVIVIHGAYVKDNKIVPAGTQGAEYMATLPVACGEVKKMH